VNAVSNHLGPTLPPDPLISAARLCSVIERVARDPRAQAYMGDHEAGFLIRVLATYPNRPDVSTLTV
jgi:hypothetical protein